MKIGELAVLTGTPVDTIRYYERTGLLPAAPRSAGNYRVYGPGHAARLAFIRHCRSLDMAHDEIRVLLRFKDTPDEDCGDVDALLDDHIGHVTARIRELRQLERQLRVLRRQCVGVRSAAQCGILNGLAAESGRPAAAPSKVGPHAAATHGGVRGRTGAKPE